MNTNLIINLEETINNLQRQIDELKRVARTTIIPSYTETERDALSPKKGLVIWNETSSSLQIYDPVNKTWTDAN